MQLHDLAGKVALVTGSSTGIGAAVAKGFAQQGTKVAVHYNASAAEAEAVVGEILAAGGIAHAFKADMRSIKACNALIAAVHAHYGRLDILVNNAGGVVKRHPLEDIDDELYDDIINLNARSVFACSRAAIPLLRPGRWLHHFHHFHCGAHRGRQQIHPLCRIQSFCIHLHARPCQGSRAPWHSRQCGGAGRYRQAHHKCDATITSIGRFHQTELQFDI